MQKLRQQLQHHHHHHRHASPRVVSAPSIIPRVPIKWFQHTPQESPSALQQLAVHACVLRTCPGRHGLLAYSLYLPRPPLTICLYCFIKQSQSYSSYAVNVFLAAILFPLSLSCFFQPSSLYCFIPDRLVMQVSIGLGENARGGSVRWRVYLKGRNTLNCPFDTDIFCPAFSSWQPNCLQ